MRILCIKNTSVLVKGSIYEVVRLYNQITNNRPKVWIELPSKQILNASPKSFTNLDGTPIDRKDWSRPVVDYLSTKIKDVRLLKKDDIIIGNSNQTKTFEFGKMYKVEETFYNQEMVTRPWSKTPFPVTTQKVRIQGYGNRWIMTDRFRLPNQQERRSTSLDMVFENPIPVITDFKVRRIDTMTESARNKTILFLLMDTMRNGSRNNMNVIDWTLRGRRGKFYDLDKKDIEPLLDRKLSEIIKMFD